MDDFSSWLCCGFIILPIPIGIAWVWVYENRRKFDFPDWFSGILAQGIISGYKIEKGDASDDDYLFIIVAAIVTTFVVTLSLYIMFG